MPSCAHLHYIITLGDLNISLHKGGRHQKPIIIIVIIMLYVRVILTSSDREGNGIGVGGKEEYKIKKNYLGHRHNMVLGTNIFGTSTANKKTQLPRMPDKQSALIRAQLALQL